MKKTKYPLANVISTVSDLPTVDLDISKLIDVTESTITYPQTRSMGNLMNHGYYLNPNYNWIIVEDSRGLIVLVPQPK
jgi:hypothetical protein